MWYLTYNSGRVEKVIIKYFSNANEFSQFLHQKKKI